MNRPLRLRFTFSSSSEVPSLAAAVRSLPAAALDVQARTGDDLFDSRSVDAWAQEIASCDAAVFVPHGMAGTIPGWPQLQAASRGRLRHLHPSRGCDEEPEVLRDFGLLEPDEAMRRRLLFLHLGGPENWRGFLQDLTRELETDLGPSKDPARLPPHGIFHPDCPDSQMPVEDYLAARRTALGLGPEAPVVGILLYHTYWVNGETALADAAIRTLEERGAIALCVFHNRFPDADEGHGGTPEVVDRYFLNKDGVSRIGALLSPMAFSLSGQGMGGVYERLGVPVLQMICSSVPYAVWSASPQGVGAMDVSVSAAQPEFDGCLITTVAATRETGRRDPVTGAMLSTQVPIPERLGRIVDLSLNWARLAATPVERRKVAVLFHHSPPRADCLGSAYGLDSFESMNRLVARLAGKGYATEAWPDGETLAHEMLALLTNDRRWLDIEAQAERAAAKIPPGVVRSRHGKLPESVQKRLEEAWGDVPGKVFGHEGSLLVGGIVRGNVFVGIQPPRGYLAQLEGEENPIHDPELPYPHHYHAYYRWLREDFGAQAVVHVGTHGSVEWLPGKSLGLSRECLTDVALEDMPNVYPYIVNNPGEGTQAKRRGAACIIDHLAQPQMSADLSPEIAVVADRLEEIRRCRLEDPGKLVFLAAKLTESVKAAHLDAELASGWDSDPLSQVFESACRKLHTHLHDVRDCAVNDGLHVMGAPPEGESLAHLLVHSTRLPFADSESLWETLARSRGVDPEALFRDPAATDPRTGKCYGDLRREIMDFLEGEYRRLEDEGWSDAAIDASPAILRKGLAAVRDHLRIPLSRTVEELDACDTALSGRFVAPGEAGCLTRGACEILPTGRNFKSLDPYAVPGKDAWDVGVRLGDALMERHMEDHGKLPKTLGIIVWGTPTMRTRGDDVAEILYLLGVRPLWHAGSEKVTGLELLPRELRRWPRIDVTVRTSSFFRDAFPNLLELMDQAVRMVACLDESDEENFLAASVRAETDHWKKRGLDAAAARRRATLRVFSERPGTHGPGVDAILESGKWEKTEDIGRVWAEWGSYAYGQEMYGKKDLEALTRRLSRMECTVQNMDSRELDILSMDDVMHYQGGMNAAVRHAGGKASSYNGDANDPTRVRIRSTAEEARFVFRTRLLNPKWIEGMKRHGYKGAGDMSKNVDWTIMWDATSGILEDWQYERLAETYALDPAMQKFFQEHNPDALHHISEHLLDAVARGMWQSPGDFKERLEEVLLQAEGDIEERMSATERNVK